MNKSLGCITSKSVGVLILGALSVVAQALPAQAAARRLDTVTASPVSATVGLGYTAISTQTTVTLTETGGSGTSSGTLTVSAGTWTATSGTGASIKGSPATVTPGTPVLVALSGNDPHFITLSLNTGSITGKYTASMPALSKSLSYVVNVINSSTVTYIGNTNTGGATAAQTTNVPTALTSNGFTRTGYSFSGWNTLSNGGGVSYANQAMYSFATNLTLYAQWTQVPTPPSCKIGDIGPGGGRVFFVSATIINVQRGISAGGRCLEAAPTTWAGTASDPLIRWGCYGTSIVGTKSAIGTGASNTKKILVGCATSNIAARRASNLTFGGLSDWFLPSRAELYFMRINLHVAGLGGFATGSYWSSSEYNLYRARVQYFIPASQSIISKIIAAHVRPIRAFG